ncbi:MAG: sulfite exporter TauE/SafE family protein [Candidatus Omnitrophota bacterium]
MVPIIFLIALLYAAVGHAGASGYIAVMTLFHHSPLVVKPTALLLNIFVASVATWQFMGAGYFSWRLFWPLALGSVPFAFLGGSMMLSAGIYKQVVGVVLLYVVFRIFLDCRRSKMNSGATFVRLPHTGLALAGGALLGFFSGLIGVGGGIFLTPIILLARWADMKTAAGVSAAFILVNSCSGLFGFLQKGEIPSIAFWLIPAALSGGYLGAFLGSRKMPVLALRMMLGVVLVLAAGKFILKL